MKTKIATLLDNLFMSQSELLSNFTLCIVCNKKETQHSSLLESEYFSDIEFEEIVHLFTSLGMATEFFLNEDEFIKFVLNNSNKQLVTYNAAQSGRGAGRKSLVPAFCNMHNIPYTGSNAYVVSLCRHKYHTNKLLSSVGFPVPQSWLYNGGFTGKITPCEGQKIILKPIYESASVGINNDSILTFNNNKELIKIIQNKQDLHKQPILLQTFLSGFEIEVPILSFNLEVNSLLPVGISLDGIQLLGENILDYERVYFDKYEFYDFSQNTLGNTLIDVAQNVARFLGIEGLGRVDFRTDKTGQFYITDVSTNPHFVTHSSVSYAFKNLGFSSIDIARTIVCSALSKNSNQNSDQNCKSEHRKP
ncbi:MAG: hypothetical protein LBV04_10450 [Deferribacteraceae bacterium]|jgi:D-alanine-D-alanine ligase|nr:hypothetical protein [Deferribacteraceae bacterium]